MRILQHKILVALTSIFCANMQDAWLANNDLVNIHLGLGGCLFVWINLMSLKSFTLFWLSILTLVFIEVNAFRLLGLYARMNVKLLLWSNYVISCRALDCWSIVCGILSAFCIPISTLSRVVVGFKIYFQLFKCLFLILYYFTIIQIRLPII